MSLDEVVGVLLGASLGARIRAARFQRKVHRAGSGDDVRLRARAHPTGAPDWRYWRGTLVRRGDQVRWRPWVRRWRSFELDGVTVVGCRRKRSAADGDWSLLDLRSTDKSDRLAVPLDCTDVAMAILRAEWSGG